MIYSCSLVMIKSTFQHFEIMPICMTSIGMTTMHSHAREYTLPVLTQDGQAHSVAIYSSKL